MEAARDKWNARLKQHLRAYPLLAFEMSFYDNIEGVRQELLMLFDDPDSN